MIEPKKINADQYKIKFEVEINDQTGQFNIDMKVRLLQVDEKTVCVEFSRMQGDRHKFNEKYQEFKEHLNKMNDVYFNAEVQAN